MTRSSALINVMEAAARKAARGLVRDFGEVEQLQVSRKGPADYVSEADRRAEETLRAELRKVRPGFGMLLEEGGEISGTDPDRRWIVDPLDGTTNFLHGIPHFAISIAVEELGEIIAGVVYDPLRDEMYWAEKGIGAYVNRRRIRVSARDNLADAVLATGIPFGGRPGMDKFTDIIRPVMEKTAGVRRFGAASLDLAYVASGRYDGFWEFGLSPWDVAAGVVLMQEAGGLVSDFSGGDESIYGGSIIACNEKLFDRISSMLRDAAKD